MHKPPHSLSAIFANADRMGQHPLNWPYDHPYIQWKEREMSRWRLYHALKEHQAYGENLPYAEAEKDLWPY